MKMGTEEDLSRMSSGSPHWEPPPNVHNKNVAKYYIFVLQVLLSRMPESLGRTNPTEGVVSMAEPDSFFAFGRLLIYRLTVL